MNTKYQAFFQEFSFSDKLDLKNRIVMAPMTNFSSNEDGTVSQEELDYYRARSKGVSMVITACTYIEENGKGFLGEFAGHTDEMIDSLASLAAAIKEEGAKAVLQIFHGGRSCPTELVPNGELVSASDVAQNPLPAPRPLTEKEIQEMIKAFGLTTKRAIEAGFDGVEIHGANGYLLQQFFSPHTNRREDKWGGSLENRLAFPLAVVREVKSVVKKYAQSPFIVGYRFSPEEPETPGITMTETFGLIDALLNENLDYLHVSVQDFWSEPRRGAEPSKSRIEWIVERVAGRVPVIGVGSIYTPEDAVKAFETNISLLALGRELIIDPEWVQKVQTGQEDQIVTEINKEKQKELVIPTPLWNAINSSPGWFPGV
ncbi:NADH-dependent flavin oxidoreductase [Niallia nealsonii]|uniref:NADH-dependent flavin oxidoreductase n=1 Tax=Niallia nealsonii TaxID=115979 RepID=A0A2N0YWI7_9BACI|nr:NADH-dependent flavin oxidoreductase [Niallia nealsonii]PKG21626.1 NADH-dependent flavin oxidoreductase [Niallia nealsonii]